MKKILTDGTIDYNLIYNEISQEINNQTKNDIKCANEDFTGEDLIEELEAIKDENQLFLSKLELIKKIPTLDINRQKQYLEALYTINNFDEINNRKKMKMLLSMGVISNYFSKLDLLNNNQLMLLSSTSMNLDLEDYTYFIGILSNPELINRITFETDNFSEQESIANKIIDAQYDLPYDYITRENYNTLVNNGFEVIDNYNLKSQK